MTKRAKSRWSGVVLVCAKCSRKVGRHFGEDGDESLAKALRRRAGKGPKAAVGVVEVRCLKLCPRDAVTVVDARRPDEWLVVPPGAPIDALADRLGLPPQA